jgi:hypothetical protein
MGNDLLSIPHSSFGKNSSRHFFDKLEPTDLKSSVLILLLQQTIEELLSLAHVQAIAG